jgi:hypothetical protein
MTGRVAWRTGDYVSIQLRSDLFTIAQMSVRPVIRFFDVASEENEWNITSGTHMKPLFQVFVGGGVLGKLAVGRVKVGVNFSINLPSYWITPYTSMDVGHYKGGGDCFMFLGGKLVDLGPNNDFDVTAAPVLKHDLSVCCDRDAIERYELTNMWGEYDLKDRLLRYFETAIDRDDLKFEVFPGLWSDRELLRPLTRRLPAKLR